MLGIFLEALPTALGTRSILLAAGELMEAVGRSEEAEKNRLCGRRFVWLAIVLTLLLGVCLLLAQMIGDVLPPDTPAGGTTRGEARAVAVAFALYVAAGVVYLTLWGASIRRVLSAYRAAKELTD